MYTGIKHLHSGIAYLLLAALVIVIIYALVGTLSNRTYTQKDQKIAMIPFVLSHIQFLAGLILYFVSPLGFSNLSHAMESSVYRLYAIEHPVINLIAVALISIGYSKAKKGKGNKSRFRSIYMFYAIALVLLLSRIPWDAWLG